jgi:nitrogen fixation-related uncharacterized protein
MESTASEAALLAEYGQVCELFKELTEIRFKLLGFLPLGTVATLGIVTSQKEVPGLVAPVALFGVFVILAIFVYSLRNDQHYDELVGRAAQIERELGLLDGSFGQRPARWHRLGPGLYVEHRWPIQLIYVASIALWIWMGLSHLAVPTYGSTAGLSIIVAVASVFILMWYLGWTQQASSRRWRGAVRDAMDLLVDASAGSEAEQRVEDAARALALALNRGGKTAKGYEKKMLFYLKSGNAREYLPNWNGGRLDVRMASYMLANAIDMPARWIRDIHTGRRGG